MVHEDDYHSLAGRYMFAVCEPNQFRQWPVLISALNFMLQSRDDVNGAMLSDVKLRASPVAALSVVLGDRIVNQYNIHRPGESGGTHLDFCVRFQAEPLGNGSTIKMTV